MELPEVEARWPEGPVDGVASSRVWAEIDGRGEAAVVIGMTEAGGGPADAPLGAKVAAADAGGARVEA